MALIFKSGAAPLYHSLVTSLFSSQWQTLQLYNSSLILSNDITVYPPHSTYLLSQHGQSCIMAMLWTNLSFDSENSQNTCAGSWGWVVFQGRGCGLWFIPSSLKWIVSSLQCHVIPLLAIHLPYCLVVYD